MAESLLPKTVFLVAIFTLVSPVFVRADNLSGRVLDPQGNAVANAKIELFDRNSAEQRNTLTGKDGGFRFEGIPSGAYLLEAHAADSALAASQEVAVRGSNTLDVNLSLAAV